MEEYKTLAAKAQIVKGDDAEQNSPEKPQGTTQYTFTFFDVPEVPDMIMGENGKTREDAIDKVARRLHQGAKNGDYSG
jgi:hypothetical protein